MTQFLLLAMIGHAEYYSGETEEESEQENIIDKVGAPSLPLRRRSYFGNSL